MCIQNAQIVVGSFQKQEGDFSMNPEKKATVLAVDDDPCHLTTLKTVIKSWGYRVVGVDDGSRAVEKIQEGPFNLVLMDVRMAVMGGIEALQKIKQYNPAIPVLIMTAYSSVESAVDALKAGAYDYLTKPLDFDALKITMERALEHIERSSFESPSSQGAPGRYPAPGTAFSEQVCGKEPKSGKSIHPARHGYVFKI